MISTGIALFFLLFPLSFFNRYKLGFLNGLSVFLFFAVLGSLSAWRQDIRLRSNWLGNIYKENDAVLIKLEESPTQKSGSFKASASVTGLFRNDSLIPAQGGVILYFSKDLSLPALRSGNELLICGILQPIPASANPGGFDFQQYALFQGITHQAFLRRSDFIITGHRSSALQSLIHHVRSGVLSVLQTAFPDKNERGLAEALLIGYKDELDKALVQSYTNTGVVHIIAISGLHLGLIYWLLVKLLRPMQRSRYLKWLRPLFIITGLWLFALLAGAQPSVLRSALMFTCIVAGESLSRKSNVYNSLAVSAFLLLCYNPYWLWDAGFQLSYAAIIGIVAFMKPLYRLFTIRNKLLDRIWQLNAVTLSAQVLTIPICIFHFHQFPVYFLLANFIAVPLSSLILLAEILICCTGFIPSLVLLVGKATAFLILFMNTFIERVEALPFSVWNGLQISFVQAALLMLCLVSASAWLFSKKKQLILLHTFLISLTGFMILRSFSFISAGQQKKIIVYQQSADFIYGRKYISIPFSTTYNPTYINPSRILFRLFPAEEIPAFRISGNHISFLSKRMVLLNGLKHYQPGQGRVVIDLLILSQNPPEDAGQLSRSLDIRQVVADATVPVWKVRRWQQQCDSLDIPFHDVRAKGAFVMNL
ncbi:MAG TPA: ComEC/Rec2 family competence protein [Chitinophagaceae bacterium]|nr:ComEC/Rec2 family competence protein [Chitinophagaceae bacterium]